MKAHKNKQTHTHTQKKNNKGKKGEGCEAIKKRKL